MSEPSPDASNLTKRILTAVVAVPPLLAAIVFGSPFVTVAIVAFALITGLLEFFRLLEAVGLQPLRATGFLLAAAFFVDTAGPAHFQGPVWPLAALVLLVHTLLRSRGDLANSVPSAAGTLLGTVYIGALGGTIAGLRLLDPLAEGPARVLLLMAIIMASDTLAFFTGRAFGRHRLAPLVSPGKTVEGAIGGLGGGMLAALAMRYAALPGLPMLHALALGAVAAGMGVLGDLDESLFKRWAGVKDSGAFFPGHGGMLDRMDGLLFGAPVLYYYFLYVR